MANDTYQPVPHDAAFRKQLLANPDVQAAFDVGAIEYAILDEMLSARKEAGLTQAQVAERMGTQAPAVARLENSLGGCPRIGTVARESHFESDFLVI